MVQLGLRTSYPILVLLLLLGVDVGISFVSVCSSGTLDMLDHRMQSVPSSVATIGAARWFIQSSLYPDDIVWYDTSQSHVSARELGGLF